MRGVYGPSETGTLSAVFAPHFKMASNVHDIGALMQGLDGKSRDLIAKIVAHLKSQGNFDELRRDCLEELDKMVRKSTCFSRVFVNYRKFNKLIIFYLNEFHVYSLL